MKALLEEETPPNKGMRRSARLKVEFKESPATQLEKKNHVISEENMISRIWHGWTSRENASAYEQLLQEEILPAIAKRLISGYRGAHLLRRESGNEIEFITILWFDSIDTVREFAGADYEHAVVPEKAQRLLSRYDDRSAHYETIVEP